MSLTDNIFLDFTNWFWGLPILILIGGGGLIITFILGGVQITKFPYICKTTFGKMFGKAKDGEVSPFSAAIAALASSIGASNIVGVPVAIALGGPGAVFWIWALAIIGCATKYAEVALSIMYREKNSEGKWVGGAAYYLKNGIGGALGKFMGIWFAFFLMIEIVPSIASQAASASSQFTTFGINPVIIGIIIAIIVVAVCFGGLSKIAKITDFLVPFMAAFYLLGGIVVIAMNVANVPTAFALIFSNAFSPAAAMGGFGGSAVAMTIRWGAARGVYSNEAGMGTAGTAHAEAAVDHPVRQAVWGVFEVVVDTLMVCTITALVILTSGVWTSEGASANGGSLAQLAYTQAFGSFGNIFIAVCVFAFVLSTIIVIAFYGEKQAEVVFGTKFSKIWRWIYPIAIIIATTGILDLTTLYMYTDFTLGVVIIPNMIGVIWMAPRVAAKTKEFFNTPGKYYLAEIDEKKMK